MSKILLIDGNSIANRAFYALPLLSNSKGIYTNAVVGFMNMLFKFYEEEQPDLIRIAFDLKAPTFRHVHYAEYKGQRKGMPEELQMQMPIIKELLGLMNIPIMQMEGFEADDLIGTTAKAFEAKGYDVTIVSGDRDLFQVATDKIAIKIPRTRAGKTEVETIYEKDMIEKYGVTPKEFIDVKALMGDASDNIPGVPGIGEKTAYKLIGDYKSLDNLYAHIDEISGAKAKQNLIENKDVAYDSQFLVTIKLDVPMDLDVPTYGPIWNDNLAAKLIDLETKTLYERLKKNYGEKQLTLDIPGDETKVQKEEKVEIQSVSIDKTFAEKYKETIWVKSDKELNELKDKIKNEKEIIVRLFKEEGELLALSLGLDKAYYIEKSSMLNEVENINEDDMQDLLYEIFENENLMKIGYDLKSDFRFLISKKEGFRPVKYYDLMIAYYSWTTSNGPFGLRDFATNYLGCDICNEDETFIPTGKAKERILVIDLEEDKRSKLLVEFFNAVSNGKDNMDAEFKQDADKGKLFTDIENPLVYVLAKIEATGITVDTEELRNYSKDINDKLKVVTEKIYELAGEEFNISSPKQLGEILFTKLGIESKKKTKTGMSTSAETLEKLVDVHPIIPEILSYRQLEKLRSTYADGLFEYIKSDNKIHTTFTQVVTSTGRLSSTDPNLQNIPIRMELGRQVRKAFVPKSEDYVFVDADYSQVELRIMAHMSGDQKLIEGYKSKEDIHKLTASEVFGVPLDEVTKEQRSAAKAVNFGIIYGISSFGLSEDIHVTKKEAQSYIEKYFEKYSRVKEYLDELVSSAEKTGCSKTLFGRMRKIDEIHSTNFMRKEFGKRAAMNSPIQGTAADIMKLAMVKFNDRIEKEKLDAKILVQVHDELLVECHKDIKEKVGSILEEEMEKACELLVPLVAEVSYGSAWYETK